MLFATPVRSVVYDWDTSGWIWTEGRPMRILNKVINLGGYSVAVAVHIVIFVALKLKVETVERKTRAVIWCRRLRPCTEILKSTKLQLLISFFINSTPLWF